MGQVARRKSEHEARNQAAKLTPQEKRDKKKRKLREDTSKELQVRAPVYFFVRGVGGRGGHPVDVVKVGNLNHGVKVDA